MLKCTKAPTHQCTNAPLQSCVYDNPLNPYYYACCTPLMQQKLIHTHTKTHEENCEIWANGLFLGEIIITQDTKFGVLVSQL